MFLFYLFIYVLKVPSVDVVRSPVRTALAVASVFLSFSSLFFSQKSAVNVVVVVIYKYIFVVIIRWCCVYKVLGR